MHNCEEMEEIEVEFVCEDLCACRVCLATDVRLEALYPGRLAETYEQLTGMTVSPTDGLPQHLCSMCTALLKKSAAFRSKCLNTLGLLQMIRRQMQPLGSLLSKTEITMPLIRNLDRKYLKLPYVTSEMLTVSALGDSSNTIEEIILEESEEDCVQDCESNFPIKFNAEKYVPYLTLVCNDVLDNKDSSCNNERDMFDSDTESTAEINTVDNLYNKSTKLNKNMLSNYIKMAPKTKHKSADLNRQSGCVLKTKEELDEFGKTYNFDVIMMTTNEQILDLEQSRKKILSYEKWRFKCEECFKGFKSEIVYKNHMTLHDPASGSHVCEVCKYRYPTVRKLNSHTPQHRLKYVCRECQQCFRNSSAARQHHSTHMGVSYRCQFCRATFRKYASRVNHIRIHHGAATCDICYEGFQGATGVALHKIKAHKKTYQCASCDVHFDNALAMKRHIESSPDRACDPNIRACAKCGEPCASAEQLDEHVARAHPSRRPGQNRTDESCNGERKKRVCIERKCCCCPHFDVGQIGDGESVVPNSGSCPCGDEEDNCLCPFGSARSCRVELADRSPIYVGGVLRKPRWAHTGCCYERRLKRTKVMCEVCAATCQTDAALRRHQLVHTGEKPFQCSECPKRFRTKVYLQIHMKSHTEERLFKCSLCPTAFKTHMGRYRHLQQVHSEGRPHSCEMCGKTFKTSTDVKTHVRTVHMKIPQKRRVRNRKRKIECTDSE